MCQLSAQQPVQTELLMRYHQLQSRLATLKIENEEVRTIFKLMHLQDVNYVRLNSWTLAESVLLKRKIQHFCH